MKHAFLMQLSDGSEINPISPKRVFEVMRGLKASVFEDGGNYCVIRDKTARRASLEFTYFSNLGWFMIYRRSTDALSPLSTRALTAQERAAWHRRWYRHDTWLVAPGATLTRQEMLRVLKHFLQSAEASPMIHWADTKDIRKATE
ncbi:MAG: hypothetical protein IT464_09975 [Planctomycetes bacterium]|nr:hypothetical protein [Planctomycetota bacterium]